MKTAEPKISSHTAHLQPKRNQPFFAKQKNGDFFSKGNEGSSHFFRSAIIQPKLTVGEPNDKYEKEADAMADKVVQRLAEPGILSKKEMNIQAKPLYAGITPLLQAKCAHCEEEEKLQKKDDEDEQEAIRDHLQKKPIFESNAEAPDDDSNIQRKCAACENAAENKQEEKLQLKEEEDINPESPLELQRKPIFESNAEPPDDENNVQLKCATCEAVSEKKKDEKLQRKSNHTNSTISSSKLENSLNSSKGSGAAIPSGTRMQMENSFGTDFSNVRLHTDSTSIGMNQDLHAHAFTHGNDIYFNSGKYDVNSKGGKSLLAHELTHVVQQVNSKSSIRKLIQRSGGAGPSTSTLPLVDTAGIPPIWQKTPLPLSNGKDVFIYRGVANDATGKLASGILADSDAAAGGVVSRSIDAAHDAIFNLVGRDPVLTGPKSGGVIRIRIPSSVWDELVKTNNVSERSYPGFSRNLNSTEVRVNSVEAIRVINGLTKDVIPPDPYYDFRPGAARPSAPKPIPEPPAVTVPGELPPTEFKVQAEYKVLNNSKIPGSNNTVIEVETILGEGLEALNKTAAKNNAPLIPERMVIRIVISPEGALVAAESAAGEANPLVQFLAKRALETAPKTSGVSPWVKGAGWVGLALFIGVTYYRYQKAPEGEKNKVLAQAGGGFVGGMVTGYIVCNLVLGIETLGWSLLICGFLAGIPGGMAGEAIADVAYDEATIDDDEIRDWAAKSSLEQIRILPFLEKVKTIFSLMKGWVSDDDIVAIEKICQSINNRSEFDALKAIVEPQLINLSSIGQRTRIRVAFARRIQQKAINETSADPYEKEANNMAEKVVRETKNQATEQKAFTQQNNSSFIQRTPDPADVEGSCPTYEPDEITKSRTAAGWLPQDVTDHTPDDILFADFGNNQTNVKREAQAEPLWISWKSTFISDGSYRIQIVGYSDCSGSEDANISVRQARASSIETVLGAGIARKLSFRGMAALGQMVVPNDTVENRAKNRSVIIKHKQGFFFDTEAIENASQANLAIQAALAELSSSTETRERNVPGYVSEKSLTIEPLTPRHDTTITTPTINFFAGSSYAHSFVLPASTRFHIYNSNANIAVQARDMPNIADLASNTQIKERIVQAVTEIANLAAAGAAAGTSFEQYKAQFNAWWPIPPYNALSTEFNLALDSFGPRTNKAREIFKKIYSENTTVKNDYDNNTGGIKEKIDTYNIPEGFNLINSSRLQVLRDVFTANTPPISNAGYPAFKTAIETAAANLEGEDRNAVSASNDWQRLINQYITDVAKRREIISVINTPPAAPAPLPVTPPTPPPPSPGGGSGAARTFLNNIHITGPTAPTNAINKSETVSLIPESNRPNPGLSFSSQFTVTPAARVIGNNISAASPWPGGSIAGVSFDPEIANTGNITMTAHLDVLSLPTGTTAPAVPDLAFTINDNRQANLLAGWFPSFEYSLPGGNTEWYDPAKQIHYVGGSQQFRISAWLPVGSVNPGLTLSVVSRLKKAGVVVQNNTASPVSFPDNSRSSERISFNVTAPATVPVAGEAFNIEVDILDNAGVVLGTKPINFTLLPEITYTEADAIRVATEDNNFFQDNTTPAGLLTKMRARGGLAERVATAVIERKIVLLPMTARHDSAAYVATPPRTADPSKTGYFVGIDYSHSMVDVAGAAAFRTYSFPALGDKVIVINRTTDVAANNKRSDDEIVMLFIHESVHAMDVRPDSGTEIERYKTEFRAYWMDGRYGPPDHPVCPVGYAGTCHDATFDPTLQPPGPKSKRARIIFNDLYNNPVTYPFVKPAYDNNPDFRLQVDNYIYPDGINLMVSIRLENLRALIEAYTGTGFTTLRQQVRRFMGLEMPIPAGGALDAQEKTYISSSRAWRDLVERKVTVAADQASLKSDLGIPTAVGP